MWRSAENCYASVLPTDFHAGIWPIDFSHKHHVDAEQPSGEQENLQRAAAMSTQDQTLFDVSGLTRS